MSSPYEEHEVDRGRGSDPFGLAGTSKDISDGREALAFWWQKKNAAERQQKMRRKQIRLQHSGPGMRKVANMVQREENQQGQPVMRAQGFEYDTSNDAGYYYEFNEAHHHHYTPRHHHHTLREEAKVSSHGSNIPSVIKDVWRSDSGEMSLDSMNKQASTTPTWVIALMVVFGIFVTGLSAFLLVQDYFSESEAFVAPIPEEAELFESDSDKTYTGPPSISTDWDSEFDKIEYQDEDNQGGVVVPSVDIQSEMIATGAENNSLVLPDSPLSTWYENSVPIGGETDEDGNRTGNSIVASHVNHIDGQELAPFSRLNQVESGTPLSVRDHDGTVYEYEVVEMSLYERSAIPEEYFRKDGEHQLHLVTCSGEIIENNDANDLAYFEYNLVVTAELVEQ